MNAATVFGGVTVRKDVPRIIRVVLFVFVILVGFSRNYLGVHTPQDVVIGMVVGMLAYYAISLFFVLLVKTWIPGPAGSLISCFVQLFYVTFIHPWFIKRFEKPAAQPVPV